MGKRIESISAIPLNTQRFKCIFINSMTLMDSTAFLPSSLDELARTLRVSDHEFGILRQWEKLAADIEECDGDEEKKAELEKDRFEAATRKGVFCYDHVTGGDIQLKRERRLPPKEAFHNRLTDENASDEDYAFAQKVFDLFACRNMMDYARLYMEIDVFLLAEAVMNMRKTLYDEFKLDMCQYLSLPMMAKDIMLKVSGAEIELISDYDMVMMVQRGIRGGMSFIGQRLVELETKPCPVPKLNEDFIRAAPQSQRQKLREKVAKKQTEGFESFDPESGEPRTMLYVDANNLYGYSMTFPLPYDQFEWMSEVELMDLKEDLLASAPSSSSSSSSSTTPASSVSMSVTSSEEEEEEEQEEEKEDHEIDKDEEGFSTGRILEVTLEYPSHLHLDHHSFPLAPEQLDVSEEDLSPYAKQVLRKMATSGHLSTVTSKKQKEKCKKDSTFLPRYRAKKLTSTFRTRKEYLVHETNLRYYMKKGLKLVAIHRGIRFRQTDFIRPYIEMCTRKRQMSRTKAESDIFKLLINSLYGKTIESNDKRVDCRFNLNDKQAALRFRCPTLKGAVICDQDFSVSFHKKKEVRMDQMWAIGFSVLERSKLVMQKLYYEKLRPAFDNQCSIVMSDTDSFCLMVAEPDVETAVRKISHVMDFSNYPAKHPLRNDRHKNELGLIKNELPGSTCLTHFAGVKPKTYTIMTASDGQVMSKAKGVKRHMIKTLRYADYRRIILGAESFQVKQIGLLAKNYINRMVETSKVAFTSLYDQRWLLCAKHTCPYGSVLIRQAEKNGGACPMCSDPSLLL
jgi:hypothetical protein